MSAVSSLRIWCCALGSFESSSCLPCANCHSVWEVIQALIKLKKYANYSHIITAPVLNKAWLIRGAVSLQLPKHVFIPWRRGSDTLKIFNLCCWGGLWDHTHRKIQRRSKYKHVIFMTRRGREVMVNGKDFTLSLPMRDRMRSMSWATAMEFFSFSSRASWRWSHSHAPTETSTNTQILWTHNSTVHSDSVLAGTVLWLPTYLFLFLQPTRKKLFLDKVGSFQELSAYIIRGGYGWVTRIPTNVRDSDTDAFAKHITFIFYQLVFTT